MKTKFIPNINHHALMLAAAMLACAFPTNARAGAQVGNSFFDVFVLNFHGTNNAVRVANLDYTQDTAGNLSGTLKQVIVVSTPPSAGQLSGATIYKTFHLTSPSRITPYGGGWYSMELKATYHNSIENETIVWTGWVSDSGQVFSGVPSFTWVTNYLLAIKGKGVPRAQIFSGYADGFLEQIPR